MAVGCGAQCSKVMLIVFNIVFWLCGAGVLGLGIWMLVDDNISNYIKVFQAFDTGGAFIKYAAYTMIGVGGFVFIIGFLGCCAAMNENKCLLGMYIFFLTVILVALLAAGVLVIVFQKEILDDFSGEFSKLLTENYGKENDDTAQAFTEGMDYLMQELECCGVNNMTDMKNTPFYESNDRYPKACCEGVYDDDTNDCPTFYETGCEQRIEQFIDDRIIYIGIVGLVIAAILLFGIIFAACLCRNTGDYED